MDTKFNIVKSWIWINSKHEYFLSYSNSKLNNHIETRNAAD